MVNSDRDHLTSYLEHNTQYSLNWASNLRAMPLAISRCILPSARLLLGILIRHGQRCVIAIQ